MSFFTIVVPALNEEKYIPLLLDDLAAQTYQDFEVIVVNGNSEDKTVEKALAFESKIKLKVLNTTTRNVSHQRNLGGKKAKSPWILFMDADNRLPTYFLDGIRYQLAKNKETDLFTTLIKTPGDEPLDLAIQHVINLSLKLYQRVNKPQGFGAMIGCTKELFSELQFDESLIYLEDSTFIQDAVKMGNTYSIFMQPRYTYSLRRFNKEGTIGLIRKGASIQLDFLQGRRNFTDDRYPMLGGSYYEDISKKGLFHYLHSLQLFFKKATKQQMAQARKVFRLIKIDSD
jgi:glycosyltransferase involved in cell wall biosynthesis